MSQILKKGRGGWRNGNDLSNLQSQMTVFGAIITWAVLTLILYYVFILSHENDHLKNSPIHNKQEAATAKAPIGNSSRTVRPDVTSLDDSNLLTSLGVLMIGCNRTAYMRRSLAQLIDIRKETLTRFGSVYGLSVNKSTAAFQLPITVSLDCNYLRSNSLALAQQMAKANESGIAHILSYPNAFNRVPSLNKEERKLEGYFRIARHYHWAIGEAFRLNGALQQLILVEDDLLYSPDFFEYFLALAPLLKSDPTLICISAWNDNGKEWMINSTAQSLLYRTDFFPGLGWMLERSLWDGELRDNWPRAFWDDWLRNWRRMRNRTCIRPEISRTGTIGKKGVSLGQFFETHLQHIHFFTKYVPFFQFRKQLKDNLRVDAYTRSFHKTVFEKSTEIEPMRLKYIEAATVGETGNVTYRMIYFTRKEFQYIATLFGIMSDFKGGVPRTAFQGVVSFLYRGFQVHLAPPITRKMYIKEWN